MAAKTAVVMTTYAADVNRDTALTDVYLGLRRIGYTRIGALKALRLLGVSLADGVRVSRDVEG
jgi:hypothetical protein